MADVNLYPEEPKKVIGEYTEFFAGQLPTANDFNRWLAVLIAQGDYNTAWLDLVAQKAGVSINELYAELSALSDIVAPGSGTLFSQRVATLETNTGGWITYANLAAISGTLTSASKLKDVIPLMADKSIIRLDNTQITLTDTTKGNEIAFVEIVRYTPARTVLKGYRTCSSVTDVLAAEYFALWDFDDVVVRGFYKLMDSNDPGYVYTSVTELGLSTSTCTLTDIWNALPINSELLVSNVADLTNITFPNSSASLRVVKPSVISRRVAFECVPKEDIAPFFMGLVGAGVPSGTWIQYATKQDLTDLAPVVLWTNLSPLTAFVGQVVNLGGSLSDYESYEIVYSFQETANSPVFRTGKIPVGRTTELVYAAAANLYRTMTSIGNTSLTFSDCQVYPLNGGASSTVNARLIPLNVIGYK